MDNPRWGSRPDYNSRLAQAGLDLMSGTSEDEVFEVISAFLAQLVPETIVIIVQQPPGADGFVTRDVLGVDESLIMNAVKMIGFDPRGWRAPVVDGFREYFSQRRLVRLAGGLSELAASVLSPKVGDLVARTFGVRAALTIGIADEKTIFGAVHFLTRDEGDELPVHVIEAFVYQSFLALRSLRAQYALRESEERYRMLTESISDVVWTLDPGTLSFTYVSPSVERLRGYTPAEIIAEPMDAALTPEGAAYVRKLMQERIEGLAAGRHSLDSVFVEELEQPCKNGTTVWTEVVTSYAIDPKTGRPEVRGVTRDITERRRSEESLRVYAGLLEASPASIIVFNERGELLYANEQSPEMHGYTREEFMGLNLHDLDVPEDAEHIEERFRHTTEFGENSFEVAHYRKDGSTFPLAVRNRTAMWEGQQVVLSVGTDITERIRVEHELLQGTARLEEMVYDVAEAMGRIVEVRDPYTQGHEVRVAKLAKLLAEEMGLSADEIAGVEMAAVVHDIGKLSVPAEILNKAGVLSSVEFALIQQHPRAGYEILKGIAFPWNVAESVLQHHERMDGSGYPQGLKGDQICPTARILAVADVIEAMASHRPYRPAIGVDAGVAEIASHPKQFDTEVVAACMRLYESGRIDW
jgi:PAS domain S-box-containing protein/putative nucleotidyltransferase with HDIG domain